MTALSASLGVVTTPSDSDKEGDRDFHMRVKKEMIAAEHEVAEPGS